jgi:hypothetical protein
MICRTSGGTPTTLYKVMRFESRRGQNEKKKKKKSFKIRKNIFSLQFFFGLSFGFAFQR